MRKSNKIKRVSLLFVVLSILTLCVAFLIMSCGAGPQLKVEDENKGPFGIDLSLAPNGNGEIWVSNTDFPTITGKGFTFEALIKTRTSTSTNVSGAIFSRYDDTGAMMWLKSKVPKFGIRVADIVLNTSTVYMVAADSVTIEDDGEFHHIAGVLADSMHSHPTSATCTAAVMIEVPHLDIYVDGSFENCATSNSQWTADPRLDNADVFAVGRMEYVDDALDAERTIDGLSNNIYLPAVVDEIRFWTVSRTADEINDCKGRTLDITGLCKIESNKMALYWPLNTGTGTNATDFSGNGTTGNIFDGLENSWSGGWVTSLF